MPGSTSAFFDIAEETNAFYLQANFASGMFRGNLGLRYLDTDVTSFGNTVINNVVTPTTTKGSYDFWLPRLNVVWEAREDMLVRFGYAKDIRRPDFDQLATGFQFDNQENSVVANKPP